MNMILCEVNLYNIIISSGSYSIYIILYKQGNPN